MARDVDYIIGGFQTLGSGLQGLAQQEEERRKEREARAEKLHQELRPLPAEQADIYRELVTRLRRGEDPQRVAIEVRARRQGLLGGGGQMPPNRMPDARGPGGMSIPMMRPPDVTQEPEPYPVPQGIGGGRFIPSDPGDVGAAYVTPPGGGRMPESEAAARTPTMRDLASLQQLSTLHQRSGVDDAWREEVARANLAARLRGLGLSEQRLELQDYLGRGNLDARQEGLQQGWDRIGIARGNLGERMQEGDLREGMAYNKLAGDAPYVVSSLRRLATQARDRAPGSGAYVAQRVGDILGGRAGAALRVATDASLTQDERNFRREVSLAVQSYRRSEFGSQMTGLEFELSQQLAGEQLTVEDTIAGLTALEQLAASRLTRAQQTVPEAAQRIEGGVESANRGGGPLVPQLSPRMQVPPSGGAPSLSTLPASSGGKTVRGYKWSPDRKWRQPIYADGTPGDLEPAP
jgi:hypothetical protein